MVALFPVRPASGVSACPGHDVTINCTVVRMPASPTIIQPSLNWLYIGGLNIRYTAGYITGEPDNGIFTAVFHAGNYTVTSTATIFSVPLSHHNNVMQCQSPITSKSVTISLSGNDYQ